MADTSATICPSLRTPAQRVRHRMQRCPRWEWNHCPPLVECADLPWLEIIDGSHQAEVQRGDRHVRCWLSSGGRAWRTLHRYRLLTRIPNRSGVVGSASSTGCAAGSLSTPDCFQCSAGCGASRRWHRPPSRPPPRPRLSAPKPMLSRVNGCGATAPPKAASRTSAARH